MIPSARKIPVIVLLIPLLILEIYLCPAFLPFAWQHAIDSRLPSILPPAPDQTRITHPHLDLEVEQVIREHIWLRIGLYAFTIALLLANAAMIRSLWRFGMRR